MNRINLSTLVARDGGATLRADTLKPINPRAGFAVGIANGDGASIPADASDRVIRRTARTVARQYGAEHVGLWRDGARIVIDPVRIVPSTRSAVAIGRRYRQDAYYAFRTGRTVYLPPVRPTCACGNLLTIVDRYGRCRQCVIGLSTRR